MNTGNNLLYLLLGAMLGATAVSGWVSEQTIRGVEVARHVPRGTTVGNEVVLGYTVRNRKKKRTSVALELREEGLPGTAFIPRLLPGQSVNSRSGNTFVRRGVYPLSAITLSTTFPFGFFRKERDITLPGELVIWPRTDRHPGLASPGAGRNPAHGTAASRHAGPRGEFRGLRDYRRGDDARDIHWRSSARRTSPVVREYDRDVSDSLWVCLDLRAEPDERAEEAVEIAAALCARASVLGRRFGLTAGDETLAADSGAGHLERALDLLARVDFSPTAPALNAPAGPAGSVLVSTTPQGGGWADMHSPRAPLENEGT